jgi:enoyl reductase
MHVNRRLVGIFAVMLLSTCAAAVSAPPASASTSCSGSASVDHSVGSAQTFVTCIIIKTYPSSAPAGSPSFGNWTPPVCWLEPQYTGSDLKALVEGEMGAFPPGDPTYDYLQQLDNGYKSITPNPYHIGEDGMWWGVGCRTDDLNYGVMFLIQQANDGLSATNPWVWYAAGAPVERPNPVTPTILAQYAAAELTPPALTFSVNPGVLQTVNLSTRIYSNQPVGTYGDIEAQAAIGGMTSTVDATPSSITIFPGGPASKSAGGTPVDSITCPIVNGTFGDPDHDTCAFFYLKATPPDQPYALSASITWTYRWLENPNAGGFPVNVTVAAAPQDVTVQEVQAIVGGQH